MHSAIIVAAFRHTKRIDVRQRAATEILSDDNLTSFDQAAVSAFKYAENLELKQAAARTILTHKDLITLQHGIIVAAFKQSGNDYEKQAAAKAILTHKDMISIQQGIVVAARKQSGNEYEKQAAAKAILQAAARTILTHKDLITLQHGIIVAAFKQSGNEYEKQAAAKAIVTNPNWNERKNVASVLLCLRRYAVLDITPKFVNERIECIIELYTNNVDRKINKEFYFGILGIPFWHVRAWSVESEYVIVNWNKIDRRGITSVLYSYQSRPESACVVCRSILEGWKREIVLGMYHRDGNPHKGDHIKRALGHPDLRLLAKATAREIIKSKEENAAEVPEYLSRIAEQMCTEGIYPVW